MSNLEDIRKQLAEHNIARLSEFRNGIIAKTEELSGDNSELKDKLTRGIEELEAIKVEGAAKTLIDERVVKLKKELDILVSPNTLASLKSTQTLVERKISEIQILGC